MADEFNRALGLPGTRIVDRVGSFLPGALVFLSLLLVAFIVALLIRAGLRRGLTRLEFDRRADGIRAGSASRVHESGVRAEEA